jgi:hypothetical protein
MVERKFIGKISINSYDFFFFKSCQLIGSTYGCVCPAGYTGTRCETVVTNSKINIYLFFFVSKIIFFLFRQYLFTRYYILLQ